jgi:ribosomal protein S18 acetylase RimI-like enzyme
MTSAAPTPAIAPLAEVDFPVVRDLAYGIWHAHYDGIVGVAQVDFMLAHRCADESLRAYLGAADRWFDVLRVDGDPVGYASHALTADAGVLKLEQLYVAAARRGRGLGRLLLDHVERHAKALACPTVVLQVNKRNVPAITFYRAAGFVVREAAVFPIGAGFVMDDYVMVKVVA